MDILEIGGETGIEIIWLWRGKKTVVVVVNTVLKLRRP
jgi:hypothetical protein